jgi:ribosomal 30S subunit maturation factor RimM
LLTDKDAAFFGIRGLVKSSLDAGEPAKALTYAKTALEQNPSSHGFKSVYDLEIHPKNGKMPTVRFKNSPNTK